MKAVVYEGRTDFETGWIPARRICSAKPGWSRPSSTDALRPLLPTVV
jgi:hypothetical protein